MAAEERQRSARDHFEVRSGQVSSSGEVERPGVRVRRTPLRLPCACHASPMNPDDLPRNSPVRRRSTPPEPMLEPRDRKLRFAVKDQAGNSSATWSVIGHQRTDDVYIGARTHMREVKLSLHRTTWRLAMTEQAAARLPPSVDRVLTRWTPPAEIGPGWRFGATIVVPTSCLSPVPELTPKGRVSIFPAPSPGWGLRFDVLLGEPDHGELTITNAVGEVGRSTLLSGLAVWVVVTEHRLDAVYEAGVQQVRAGAALRAAERGDVSQLRGCAWGVAQDDGHPVILDLGSFESRAT